MINNKHIRVISLIAVILAGCFSLFPVFFGLDFTDTFYISCQHLYSGKISAFLPLTQGLYILTHNLLGDYVISYRIVNWAIYLLAYLLGFLLLCGKETKERPIFLLLLALAFVLMPLTNSNVFAGNSLTTLFIILTFASLVKVSSGKRCWFYGTSAFLALAMLSRFPNLALLAMTLVVGLLVCQQKDYLRLILSLISATAIYLITNILINGGVTGYLETITSSLNTMEASEGSNHSASTLLDGYFHSMKDMMGDIKYLAIIAVIPTVASLFKKKFIQYAGALLFIACQLGYVFTHVKLIEDIHYFLLIYFYSNICILIFVLGVAALLKHDIKGFGLSIGALLFSVCGAAGSDMSLFLMGGPLLALVPWLTLRIREESLTNDNNAKVKIVISLLLLSASAILYVRKGMLPIGLALLAITLISAWIFANKNIKLPFLSDHSNGSAVRYGLYATLLAGGIFSAYALRNVTFGDLSPKELKCTYEEPTLKWIRTNSLSHDFLEDVMANYRVDTTNNKVVFFGANSAVFSYITHTGMIRGVDFTQDPSPRNLAIVEEALAENPTLYLCPENPARSVWYSLEAYAPLDSIMTAHNYTCKAKGLYSIYYPSTLASDAHEDSIQ